MELPGFYRNSVFFPLILKGGRKELFRIEFVLLRESQSSNPRIWIVLRTKELQLFLCLKGVLLRGF